MQRLRIQPFLVLLYLLGENTAVFVIAKVGHEEFSRFAVAILIHDAVVVNIIGARLPPVTLVARFGGLRSKSRKEYLIILTLQIS
jgi:hypothetical protein